VTPGPEPARPLLGEEHEEFRRSVRAFVEREVVPHHPRWEAEGQVSREVWARAGAQGLLCFDVAEEYGGPGVADFRYNLVVGEELARVLAHGPGFSLHTDVVVPYLSALGTDEQKRRWLPGCVAGETVTAIAMTEPGAGSDLRGIRTSAVDEGDHYLLSGSKTFVSNGTMADLVVVVARTGDRHSLLVVEAGMSGLQRGRRLDKVGMPAQDTSELFFDEVAVPKRNLLGVEGAGLGYLMARLPQERLSIAVTAAAACEAVLDMCLRYAKDREAFGHPIGSFQHTRFLLAEMATETHLARVLVDDCVRLHNAGRLDTSGAAMAKWWTTELQKRMADRGVQLFGGYGYMREYPIARAFLDSRVQTIYGGTTEIQKEIIGRSLGL
jgi:acyl-CoA dehydrogenase